MPEPAKKRLTKPQVKAISSAYLNGGKDKDKWDIGSIEIDGKTLTATISMRSYYTSASDPGGFHLTPFSALEFLSQLTIIFVHAAAGYKQKSREVWMLESSIRCKNVIRNPKCIGVSMKLTSMKKVKGHILFETKSKVSDEAGMFEIDIKGLLS